MKLVILDERKAELEKLKEGKSKEEKKRIEREIEEIELEKLKIELEKRGKERDSAAATALGLALLSRNRKGKEEEWEEDEIEKLIRELPEFLYAGVDVTDEEAAKNIGEQREVIRLLKEMKEGGYLTNSEIKDMLTSNDMGTVKKIQATYNDYKDYKEIVDNIDENIGNLSEDEKYILVALRTELGGIDVDEALSLLDYIDAMIKVGKELTLI